MNIKTVLLVLLVVGGGVYWFTRPPAEAPDITEAQARTIADDSIAEFCLVEKEQCAIYNFTKVREPGDTRFKWAFEYVSQFSEPTKKVTVNVGRKGDKSIEFAVLTEEEVAALGPMPGGPALGSAPPAEGGEAPPGEAPPAETPPAEAPAGEAPPAEPAAQ